MPGTGADARVERKIERGVVAAEHLDEVSDLELCQEFR
jgi:hypothetical protein